MEEIINKVESGNNVALVSDAGTPAISDPGEDLVKMAIEKNLEIVPIPGPCALISALIVSGIDTREFTFLGFLPLNKKLRKQKLNDIKMANKTIILYEAPHKLQETLKDLQEITQKRKIVLAREITKIHEQYIAGTATELLNKIIDPKGEFVIVIDKSEEDEKNIFENMNIEEHYKYYENKRIW